MASAIKNLGQAVRHSMVLKVTCGQCSHAAHFLAGDVAQFVDPGKPLANLPFRCHECRGTQCRVVAMEVDRDRHPKIVVWRPVRF